MESSARTDVGGRVQSGEPEGGSHVMSLDEMIAAEPIPATEPRPADWSKSDGALIVESDEKPDVSVRVEPVPADGRHDLWTVEIESPTGPVGGLLGKEQGRLERQAPSGKAEAIDGYRPPWLANEYFPRVAPRRLDPADGLFAGALSSLGTFSPMIAEQLSREYPWSTMGKVWVGRSATDFNRAGKPQGSGVLVGRNLLMTVSHGAPWGAPSWWIEFVPAYASGGEPFGKSYVESYHGIKNENDVTGLDYVICKLYTPLGDRCGWMGSQKFGSEDRYYAGSWTSVGYPTSFMGGDRPAVEAGIGVQDIDNDGDGLEIETHKFAEKGWSGGPLWGWIDGQPKVIGIESGYEKDFLDPTRTVFAGGQHMVDLVKYGLANWP